ncbi:amino acid permease [Coralloluteibacterium stylophorae]|uniref:Arginine/agmatine antiporter n=1 Tax=Coralloluteibacterium stylophorae TaxID=1776034 RepID=A0A8J7VX07_9GAMM|nr:amino acid permease [Coralloluteibacterium stylophorae]MBS7458727.1 amino acid permease [Coralloluteibacterium stylophorae]
MTEPTRRIGPLLATFMVANNMIGSGFFLLPASLAGIGSISALSWILATLLASVLGMTFARLARTFPDLESPADYVTPSLGRDAGFLAATLYWLSSWIGNNAIAVAAIGYLVVLLPASLQGADTQIYGQIGLLWLVFALNLCGPKPIARFQSACLVLGLLPVLMVLGGGWLEFDGDTFRAAWNTTGEAWNTENAEPQSGLSLTFGALAPIFWAFIGLETSAMVAGVVRNPSRNVPLATLGGILIAGVVYVVSSVLVMGIVPADVLFASSAPFAEVAARVFGPWAAVLIAGAAALKATGTLGGWMLVTGESGARAAQRGLLPGFFGRYNRNGAAHAGLAVIVVAMSVLAWVSSAPTIGEQFGTIINMAVLLVTVMYATAGLTLILGTPERRPGPGDRLLGTGAIVACALLVLSSPVAEALGALAIAVVAWVAFRLFGRRARLGATPS